MKRNNDVAYKIAVTKDGDPVDITDWTFYMAAKKNKNTPDEDALFYYPDEQNTVDPATGIITIDILAADTKDKPLGNYQCDILVKDQYGKRRNSQTFIIELLHEVTDGDE